MVKRPCPVYYKGVPGPIQRWIEHKILGGPLLLQCDDCGEHHIQTSETSRVQGEKKMPNRTLTLPQALAEIDQLQLRIQALTRDNAALLTQYRKAQRQLKTCRIKIADLTARPIETGSEAAQ